MPVLQPGSVCEQLGQDGGAALLALVTKFKWKSWRKKEACVDGACMIPGLWIYLGTVIIGKQFSVEFLYTTPPPHTHPHFN